MDPLSAVASGIQIGVQCTTAIVSLAQWIEQVKTVDERVKSFYNELVALRATYNNLDQTLREPSMQAAAKGAQKTAGGRLWAQIRLGLEDCQQTLLSINTILDKINRKTVFSKPVKQLREHLASGDLSRLRQRVQMFNSTLSLPLQMIVVMNQLDQQDLSVDQHKQLGTRISDLSIQISRLAIQIRRPGRTLSLDGSTVLSPSDPEAAIYGNMNSLAVVAEKFISSASAAASTKASTRYTPSTVHAGEAIQSPIIEERRISASMPLTQAEQIRIEQWIKPPDSVVSSDPMQNTDGQSATTFTRPTTVAFDDESDDDDSDVFLTLADKYLKNGRLSNEKRDYAKAEKHFRKALSILEENDFGDALAIQSPDVVLMISQACLDQNKIDEAIELLLPMSSASPAAKAIEPSESASIGKGATLSNRQPDRLQALTADFMLGEAFLRKPDFENAEKYSLLAFRGRRRRRAQQGARYLESVRLVIEVYKANGEEESAETYEVFLKEAQESISHPPALQEPVPEIPQPAEIDPLQREDTGHSSKGVKPNRTPFPLFRKPRQSSDLQPPNRDRPPFCGHHTVSNEEMPWMAVATTPLAQMTTYKSHRTNSTTSSPPIGGIMETIDIVSTEDMEMVANLSTQDLETRFMAIEKWTKDGKQKAAWKSASSLLTSYPNGVWIHRQDELRNNVKKSNIGLAGTGHGYSPLHFFAGLTKEYTTEVKILLNAGADVNATAFKAGYNNGPTFTPFQLAVKNGHSNIVRLFLATPNIDTQVRDEEGFQPILIACRNRFYNIVNQLLDHGPPPTVNELPAAWSGNSLLHDACRSCDTPLVKILIDRRFSVNQQDRYGKTPLMHAIIKNDIANHEQRHQKTRGRLDCVRILLEAGADLTLEDTPVHSGSNNNKRFTAFDYAEKEDDLDLVALLNKYKFRGSLIDLNG